MTRKELGSWLKEKRLKKGFSQKEMSQFLGVESRQTVTNLENGKNPFPAKYVRTFCYWTDVSVDLLVERMIEVYRTRLWEQVEASETHIPGI